MTSLWKLFFKRPRDNTYARLDGEGRCLAFKRCGQAPTGSGWVQVSEARLAWLGRPLPGNARVCTPARRGWQERLLAA